MIVQNRPVVRRLLLDSRDRVRPESTSPFDFTVALNGELGTGSLKNVTAVELKGLVFPKIADEDFVYVELNANNIEDASMDVSDPAVCRAFAAAHFDNTDAAGVMRSLKGKDFYDKFVRMPAVLSKLSHVRCTFRKHGGALVTTDDTLGVGWVAVILEITCDGTMGSDYGTGASAYVTNPVRFPVTLLDTLGTMPVAAYSVSRQLISTYTGPAFLLATGTSSTDFKSTDVYFKADGTVDTDAIADFCGVNTGYVSVVYDQTGLGRDAFVPNPVSGLTTSVWLSSDFPAANPVIWSGGVLQTLGGRPTMTFFNNLLVTKDYEYNLDALTISCVCTVTAAGRNNTILAHNAINTLDLSRSWSLGTSSGSRYVATAAMQGDVASSSKQWTLTSTTAVTYNTPQVLTMTYAAKTLKMYRNTATALTTTGTYATPTDSLNNSKTFLTVGAQMGQAGNGQTSSGNKSGSTLHQGRVSEWFIFDEAVDLTALQTDMTAHYGI